MVGPILTLLIFSLQNVMSGVHSMEIRDRMVSPDVARSPRKVRALARVKTPAVGHTQVPCDRDRHFRLWPMGDWEGGTGRVRRFRKHRESGRTPPGRASKTRNPLLGRFKPNPSIKRPDLVSLPTLDVWGTIPPMIWYCQPLNAICRIIYQQNPRI